MSYFQDKKVKDHIWFHYLLAEIHDFFETENIPGEVLIEIRDKSVTYNKIRI